MKPPSMPGIYADKRNMVFHKRCSATDHFFTKRKELMSKTIETSHEQLMRFSRGLAPSWTPRLVAEWQAGPQTLAGYEQRKLRFTFAPSSLAGAAAYR